MPELTRKISDKSAVIGVIGLGYVGLPLAASFSKTGYKVIGFDSSADKVSRLNCGESFLSDISVNSFKSLPNGMEITGSFDRLNEADVIIICVPTPLSPTKEPDLSSVIAASQDIAKRLRSGQLIVMESTTFPGTTRDIVLPILEKSGLMVNRDFYLAYSPERIDPGNKKFTVDNTPKVVAGMDEKTTNLTRLLYEKIVKKVIPLSCPEAAEMTKIFENIFRSVNIALVNELAQLCHRMEIDVWEVIDAAATKPFGFMPFQPGPGIGGHCIPLDPYYLAYKAREYDFHTRFIELAGEINEMMPYYASSRIMEALNDRQKSLKSARLLVLGVAYKQDIGDTRESPALKLIKLLKENGAEISYNDPYVPEIKVGGDTYHSVELDDKRISASDCVVIVTGHSCYDYREIASSAKMIFDTRGVTRGIDIQNVVRL